MKHVIVLLSLLMTTVVAQEKFPVGAYRIFQSNLTPGIPSHATQLEKILPLMESASITFGKPFTHHLASDEEIFEVLDSAAAHGLDIILPQIAANESGMQRFIKIIRVRPVLILVSSMTRCS